MSTITPEFVHSEIKNESDTLNNNIINRILNNIPIGQSGKFIANSILHCHLHQGSITDENFMDKFKEVVLLLPFYCNDKFLTLNIQFVSV